MSFFGQFAATTQFYLYGKRYCTKTGWEKAQQKYPRPDILQSVDLSGRVYLITGANSGIGFEAASYLASRNAIVYMVCRNRERAEAARGIIVSTTNNEQVIIIIADCSLQCDIKRVWEEFNHDRLDGILCNAGALTNDYTSTKEGIEITFASHLLFGTYLLVELAINILALTPDSRVIVVSSGGMYNTSFPSWERAVGLDGKYDGQFAYAYAKRGQVLLCEEWTEKYPAVKFASCHPGWVDTPGVESAYGAKKSYLEPLRNLWQGTEGIIWLLVTPSSSICGGGFYLDRTPRTKHLSGPFFTEGSFTKNSAEEVQSMLNQLEMWSKLPLQEGPLNVLLPDINDKKNTVDMLRPLAAMQGKLDIARYMGRWFVHASIPTLFDRGTVNNIAEYDWDEAKKRVKIVYKYALVGTRGVGEDSVRYPKDFQHIYQRAMMANSDCTEWHMSVKMLLYIPIPTKYLVLAVNEEEEEKSLPKSDVYSLCMVGVPDRSALWIMSRSKLPLSESALGRYYQKAAELGYDTSKINLVPILEPSEDQS